MKKLISILLTAALMFSLAGCGAVKDVVSELASAGSEIVSDIDSALDDELQSSQTSASTAQSTEAPTSQTTAATTEPTTLQTTPQEAPPEEPEPYLDPDGTYTTKDDVALYIYLYGCLPNNFITKKEAQALGWEGGSLEPYASGMCIGGSYFGNYEGLLPEKDGREYTECDIDTLGAKSRGAKRIVFSNDGLIYYTDDHYESFTLLYGEE